MGKGTFTKLVGPQGEEVWGRDLDFEVIKEGVSEYKLEDGTIIEVKYVTGKISRLEDRDSGELSYTEIGEPIYSLRHTVLTTIKVRPEMYKKS